MECPIQSRRPSNALRDLLVVVDLLLLPWTPHSDALAQMARPPGPIADAYLIQIGDQVDIKFFYSPTLNEQVTVRPDGRISLQLIEEVPVVGMTAAAPTADSVDLRQPEVTVIVRAFGAQRVFVDGEVGRSRPLPARRAAQSCTLLAGDAHLCRSRRNAPKRISVYVVVDGSRLCSIDPFIDPSNLLAISVFQHHLPLGMPLAICLADTRFGRHDLGLAVQRRRGFSQTDTANPRHERRFGLLFFNA